jgi:hypothetical protein
MAALRKKFSRGHGQADNDTDIAIGMFEFKITVTTHDKSCILD